MKKEVKRICIFRDCLGKTIEAEAILFSEGVHVSVYGGDRPHIGALSVADPEGNLTTTQFPGHRDAAISARWARALGDAGAVPAVVTAGIHYDGLSPDGIAGVLECTDRMLSELLAKLKEG